MSILSLAALPAATGVARDAVAGGAQMGQQFLSLLAQVATAGAQAAREGAATASGAQSDSTATALAADTAQPDTITQRSESLAQRIASWLQQQPWLKNSGAAQQPVSIELSLDQLDRPRATLGGQSSPELDAALASHPDWLDEFRDLALDRLEQSAPSNSNWSAQSLTIQQDSATMDVQHRWN